MIGNLTELSNILNSFYFATDIGAMHIDRNLNITAVSPSDEISAAFLRFGMNQITPFLTNRFYHENIDNQAFYTFFFEHDLVCNICFLTNISNTISAIVTQPTFIDGMTQQDLNQISEQDEVPDEKRNTNMEALSSFPKVRYEKAMSLGKILHSLTNVSANISTVKQVIYHSDTNSLLSQGGGVVYHNLTKNIEQKRLIDYEIYVKVKEYIEKGDPQGLITYLSSINTGAVKWEHLITNDFMRSLKNGLITSSALGCSFAIEAGVQYEKVMDLSDDAIRKVENLENTHDIYELLKSTIVAYAREVLSSRSISYSKPVRQILNFIEKHYARKISLDMLSKHTHFSIYHISNLLKKETGLSLTENINRIRIEKGKKLLMNSDNSVLDIAQQVGYQYQNHFAAVFKKYTGFSPSEYKTVMGGDKTPLKRKSKTSEDLPVILHQLNNKLKYFNDLYDHARIVDIKNNKSWVINKAGELSKKPQSCFENWSKSEPCCDCVSVTACKKNTTSFKVIEQHDDAFLVVGIPVAVGKNKYAVEVIKKISGSFIYERDHQI